MLSTSPVAPLKHEVYISGATLYPVGNHNSVKKSETKLYHTPLPRSGKIQKSVKTLLKINRKTARNRATLPTST